MLEECESPHVDAKDAGDELAAWLEHLSDVPVLQPRAAVARHTDTAESSRRDPARLETQEPWHKKQERGMQEARTAVLYPPRALHPELFEPSKVDEWFSPALRQALSKWQETRDVRDIDVASIPGLRLEAPGVVSFECLLPAVCDKILSEATHYSNSGLPQKAPNSMNRYGLVLNEIGLRASFDAILHRFMAALGALFFGAGDQRLSTVLGNAADLQNWGGSSLSDHHTFIVRYRADEDRRVGT